MYARQSIQDKELRQWKLLQTMAIALIQCRKLADTDCGNLFPEDVAEWCYLNLNELGMMAIELEESDNLIEE